MFFQIFGNLKPKWAADNSDFNVFDVFHTPLEFILIIK